MKLHPRTQPVAIATAEIRNAVLDLAMKHDLTPLEVARALHEIQRTYLTMQLRAERHPDDPDRKADEE